MTVNEANAKDSATILKEFLKEFPDNEVKLKPAMVKNNRCLALAYLDARCIMDRLDEVVGINGWKDEYTVLPGGTEVECRLSVRIAGEWITKADVGGESEQPDGGDRMKAAFSDALKRAAVKFGIGRFLYRRPQQWMDYDPVKKQIIRPGSQQAKPATTVNAPQQAKAPAAKEHPLLVTWEARARTAPDRETLTGAWKQYEAQDARDAPGDVHDRIVAAFQAAAQKFPKQPAKA